MLGCMPVSDLTSREEYRGDRSMNRWCYYSRLATLVSVISSVLVDWESESRLSRESAVAVVRQ